MGSCFCPALQRRIRNIERLQHIRLKLTVKSIMTRVDQSIKDEQWETAQHNIDELDKYNGLHQLYNVSTFISTRSYKIIRQVNLLKSPLILKPTPICNGPSPEANLYLKCDLDISKNLLIKSMTPNIYSIATRQRSRSMPPSTKRPQISF